MAELCTVAIYHGLNSPLLLETLTRPGMILPCSATLYPLHLRLVEADCLLKGSDFHLVTHLHLAKTRQLLLSFMMLEPSHLLSYYNSTGHNASSDLGDNCPGEHCPRRQMSQETTVYNSAISSWIPMGWITKLVYSVCTTQLATELALIGGITLQVTNISGDNVT